MILSLKIATFSQLRLISLRCLPKQTQRCQPRSGACISPVVDRLSPLTHRLFRAAVVSVTQQNLLKVSESRARVSRFRAFMSAVTFGVSFLFANGAVWATNCDRVISESVTASEKNFLQLCSLTVNNGISISTSGDNINGIANTGTITTLTNNGRIETSGSDAHGIQNYLGTITTLTNNGTISTSGDHAIAIDNSFGAITTLTNSGTISTSGFFADGILTGSNMTTLTNGGTISTSSQFSYGIYHFSNTNTITKLINSGTISTIGAGSHGIANNGAISSLSNTGTISATGADAYGIFSSPTSNITTLNNKQGAGNVSGALTYTGVLPRN